MLFKQTIQRRCDRCNKATIINTNNRCQLFCTLKGDTVSKYDQCKRFVYGKFDNQWVK